MRKQLHLIKATYLIVIKMKHPTIGNQNSSRINSYTDFDVFKLKIVKAEIVQKDLSEKQFLPEF